MTKRRYFPCLRVLLAIAWATALASCGGNCALDEKAPRLASSAPAPVSRDLAVDIYVDSTLSMKGFLVRGVYSCFEQTLEAIERTIEKGWPRVTPTFHRFGTRIGDIRTPLHVAAADRFFYTDPEYNQRTFIENVVEGADVNHLSIVMTDLFQDEADVSRLTGAIRDKYINNKLAVGVLAIRSQFNGLVYDVGTRNYTFQYASGDAVSEQFRPFYLLIMGEHSDVQNFYVKMLESGLSRFPETHFVIFTEHLDDPSVSFKNAHMTFTKGLVQVGGLLRRVSDDEAGQFKLTGGASHFVAHLHFAPLPYMLPFDEGAIPGDISAWKCVKGKLVDEQAATGALQVTGRVEKPGELVVEEKIDGSKLNGEGIYSFRVVLHPRTHLPEWVDQWDMDPNQIEGWRSHPEKFDGSRTFNLKPILKDLMDTMTEERNPELGQLVCYVRKG